MPRDRHQRQRRRPVTRSRRILRTIEAVVCCALLGAGGYWFYHFLQESEYFSVKIIRVQGNNVLDGEDVIAASGLSQEDNLLFLDISAVEDRVEAIPYVHTCRVSRRFPDLVILKVEERTPIATLLVGSRCFEVDAEGVVLRELSPTDPYVSPFIMRVEEVSLVEVGERLEAEDLRNALAVVQAFRGTQLSEQVTVSELAVYGEDDIRMICDELPFEIRWGRDDFAEQGKRLDILWRESDGVLPCKQYLDLRFGNDLACK